MIWIRRLFFLPGWLVLAGTLSYFAGYVSLPTLSYESALMLAIAGGVALYILLRLFAVAALGLSLGLGLALLLAVVVCANYFLFERERDRWFNNDAEVAQVLPIEQRNTAYLKSLGITPGNVPPLDWWAHSRAQVNSGLRSQQLTPNQVGVPKPERSPEEIWLNWGSQLIMLITGVIFAAKFGSRKSSPTH